MIYIILTITTLIIFLTIVLKKTKNDIDFAIIAAATILYFVSTVITIDQVKKANELKAHNLQEKYAIYANDFFSGWVVKFFTKNCKCPNSN